MKQDKKIIFLTILVSLSFLFCSYLLGTSLIKKSHFSATPVFQQKSAIKTGSFCPTVLDGITMEPIKGAKVIIPETEKSYITDSFGKTSSISAPIARDERFDSLLPKSWGEVSVLVYKEGYLPYALFYLALDETSERNGPEILLFPDDGSASCYSIIEGPKVEWVESLLEKYDPA